MELRGYKSLRAWRAPLAWRAGPEPSKVENHSGFQAGRGRAAPLGSAAVRPAGRLRRQGGRGRAAPLGSAAVRHARAKVGRVGEERTRGMGAAEDDAC